MISAFRKVQNLFGKSGYLCVGSTLIYSFAGVVLKYRNSIGQSHPSSGESSKPYHAPPSSSRFSVNDRWKPGKGESEKNRGSHRGHRECSAPIRQ